MFRAMNMSLMVANLTGRFWYLRYANGIAVMASIATITDSIRMKSFCWAYPNSSDMGLMKMVTAATSSRDSDVTKAKLVVYTLRLSASGLLINRKKVVSIPNVRMISMNAVQPYRLVTIP